MCYILCTRQVLNNTGDRPHCWVNVNYTSLHMGLGKNICSQSRSNSDCLDSPEIQLSFHSYFHLEGGPVLVTGQGRVRTAQCRSRARYGLWEGASWTGVSCLLLAESSADCPYPEGGPPSFQASVPLDTLYPYAAKAAADAAAAPALAPAMAAALPTVDFLLRPFAAPLAVLPEPLGRPRLRAE